MIVPMSRTYIVARQRDRERLLEHLGRLGVLHIEPVDPSTAAPDEQKIQALADLNRALQILSPMTPLRDGPEIDQKAVDMAREALALETGLRQKQARLKELDWEARERVMWGDVRLQDLKRLMEDGIHIQFFSIPEAGMGRIEAECVEPVTFLPDNVLLVAVIHRYASPTLPEEAQPVSIPDRDRPSVLAEARDMDVEIKRDSERLSLLANQISVLEQEREALSETMTFETVRQSGLLTDDLFAVQGWMPSDKAAGLSSRLWEAEIPAAVKVRESDEKDLPPTLIHYPGWARPIKALFDLLGTLPGYHEMDLSPFFMVGLPIFAAMLIGDGGYGFCIALAGILFWRRIAKTGGREKAALLMLFGLVTLVWGVLTANYFGITPENLARAGGFVQGSQPGGPVDYPALWSGTGIWARAAQIMKMVAPLWRPDPEVQRFLIIKVSLILGCLHLILAHLRRLLALLPDVRAYAEVGWIVVLGDMLILIWYLLFIGAGQVPVAVWWVLLGAILFPVWFTRPEKGVGRRLLFGFASSLLPLVSAFSDTMSYLRLFAVGMASYYIAMAFNILGGRLAETATWGAAVPVLVFGHGLNIGLAGIAIFAHGVRLNMLEFSNNAGVQWAGYAYRPYALSRIPSLAEQKLPLAGEEKS